ncbi:MAG: ATP-binding protein [Bacteroidales bacterium]|nr:ATP-binding protein [Bacteroidales bacterium]
MKIEPQIPDCEDLFKKEPIIRKNALIDLYRYMTDHGRFCILLLGNHGVGKTHWIYQIKRFITEKEKAQEFYMTKLVNVNCCICANKDEMFWNDIFLKADGGLLVFDHVEELDKRSQYILFEILSTQGNGLYGYNDKKVECRTIFTSSFKIESLRDTGSPLVPNFFGRISNFVVKLPNFAECGNGIEKDFEKTWIKMRYRAPYNELPGRKFMDWLKNNVHRFHGNFRDLDNLSMNWHNCKVNGYDDEKTYETVVKTFDEFNHFPEHNADFDNFTISQDMDYYKDILPNLRAFVKEYAQRIYGKNLKNAPNSKPFGVPYRTMDRW